MNKMKFICIFLFSEYFHKAIHLVCEGSMNNNLVCKAWGAAATLSGAVWVVRSWEVLSKVKKVRTGAKHIGTQQ